MAIIYSCGNSGKGSNEQKADSLATSEQVGKKNAEQVEPQITLTVKSNKIVHLKLAAKESNTQVKIVSGKRDTSFTIGEKELALTYLSDDNTMTIYGDITTFNCWYNNNPVINLDVTKNTSLTELVCGDLPMTELDLSKNTALKYLYCLNIPITKLDFSNNTELESVICRYNINLTTLNLSKNTKLTRLICTHSKLTDIDLSNNTSLTDLDVAYNKLSSLNVSKNTKLEDISCVQNPLSDLDVSKNTALKNLYCTENNIKSFDLSNNPDIMSVYISWNPIKENPESTEAFFNSLPDRKGKKQGLVMCIDIEDYAN